jgi:hypothetical protein
MKRGCKIRLGNCRRCGKRLATGTRSLIGAEALKRKWELICATCLTPAERVELERDMRRAALAAIERRR